MLPWRKINKVIEIISNNDKKYLDTIRPLTVNYNRERDSLSCRPNVFSRIQFTPSFPPHIWLCLLSGACLPSPVQRYNVNSCDIYVQQTATVFSNGMKFNLDSSSMIKKLQKVKRTSYTSDVNDVYCWVTCISFVFYPRQNQERH